MLEQLFPDGSKRSIAPPPRRGSFSLVNGEGAIVDDSITADTVPVLRCDVANDRGDLTWTATPGELACVSSDPADASTYTYQLIG